jgi:hypothetical protein
MKKIHNWTDKELTFLTNNYNKLTTNDIAKQLNLTYDQIRSKVRFLGLDKDLKRRRKLKRLGGIRSQIKRKEDRKLSG